jgi:hypothetical protein
MSLSVKWIDKGRYIIGDQEYGWQLATVSFSVEAMEKLDDFEMQDQVERFADLTGARLRELSEAMT